MAIRDSTVDMAPPWLSNDADDAVGGKLVYELGLLPDTLTDKMNQAVQARLPLGGTTGPSGGNGGPYQDALTQLGHDRNITQGVGEPLASYGARLQNAFPTWQRAGTAQCVLQQALASLQTACRAAVVRAPVVLVSGTPTVQPFATEYGAGADPTLSPARWVPTAWLWDIGLEGPYSAGGWLNNYPGCPPNLQAPWWRDWLVLWPTDGNAWTQDGVTWGLTGAVWGDTSRSWGLSCPPTTIAAITSLLENFKAAGTWYQWVVISFDARFANWSSGSAYYPTVGDWAHWGKKVLMPAENRYVYVQARYPALRFCNGAT